MAKILLVGDIGSGKNGFYHIGDESMLYYNYKILNNEKNSIFVTSRFISRKYKNEYLDINFQGKYYGIIKLFFNLIFYVFFKKNSKTVKLIKLIKQMDYIIICGGGNINSIRPGHLYFRFFISFFAKRFRKKLFFSGQTIGPIYNNLHKLMINNIFNIAKLIYLRDKTYSIKYISKKYFKKVIFGCDDAFINIPGLIYNFERDYDKKYIGISFHNFNKKNELLEGEYLLKIIKIINKKFKKIRFFIIPHMFDKYNGFDILFMNNIFEKSGIKDYIILDYQYLSEIKKHHSIGFELIIEGIISKMDYVITTRYHGAVFGIKYGIPTIMIGRNDYEIGKFEGLIDSLGLHYDYIIKGKNNGYIGILNNFFHNYKKIRNYLIGTKKKSILVLERTFINDRN